MRYQCGAIYLVVIFTSYYIFSKVTLYSIQFMWPSCRLSLGERDQRLGCAMLCLASLRLKRVSWTFGSEREESTCIRLLLVGRTNMASFRFVHFAWSLRCRQSRSFRQRCVAVWARRVLVFLVTCKSVASL